MSLTNRFIHQLRPLCLVAFGVSLITAIPSPAAVINYAQDSALTAVPIVTPDGETTLEDALKSIESQTEYTFVYLPSEIPVSDPVTFSGDTISLADTFFKLSESTGVVFERLNGKIAIRMQTADDEIDYANAMAINLEDGPGGEVIMLDSFDVESEEFKTGSDQLTMERKVSTGMMNFLSLEDMSKFGGSDLSEVVNRMVGVNVVEGRFAVVRGLNDRYTSTLVNGLPMPSPDPMRQGVQLDLFPTSMIEEVVVHKNALPNMPMNSAAAAFDLRTKAYSEDFTAWFEAGYSVNSNALDTYLRHGNDAAYNFFPYGKGEFEPMPGIGEEIYNVNTANKNVGVTLGNAPYTPSFEFGFSDSIEVMKQSKLKFTFATSYDTGAVTAEGWQQKRIALVGQTYPEPYKDFPSPSGSVYEDELAATDLRYDLTRSDNEILLGGLGSVALQLDEDGDHELTFNVIYSQSTNTRAQRLDKGHMPDGEAETTKKLLDGQPGGKFPIFNFPPGLSGGSVNEGTPQRYFGDIIGYGNGEKYYLGNDISIYEERNLTAFQLEGAHNIEELDGLRLDWGITSSSTSSDTPQQTDFTYLYDPVKGEYVWGTKQSLEHSGNVGQIALTQTWREINEDLRGARADLAYDLPFIGEREMTLQGGFYFQETSRIVEQSDVFFTSAEDFTASSFEEYMRLVFKHGTSAIPTATGGAPNIEPSSADVSRKQTAGYLMTTLPLLEELQFSGGARLVDLRMSAEGDFKLQSGADMEYLVNSKPTASFPSLAEYIGFTGEKAEFNKFYILPSGVLTLDVTDDFIIRAGGSMTVAMPSMREMSPYFSYDSNFDKILGNPSLTPSEVYSADLRLEYYFAERSMVSLGFFYKKIDNPIERIGWSSRVTGPFYVYWNNPVTAQVRGVEFELRSGLDVIAEELRNLELGINLAYIDARVPLSQQNRDVYLFDPDDIDDPDVGYGYAAGPGGPRNIPDYNRMIDQPEWTANADLTWRQPDWGSRVSIILYAQSDVLESVGTVIGGYVDQYTLPYYDLKFVYAQEIWDGLAMKFTVSNITNTERGRKYSSEVFSDPPTFESYKVGQTYELKLSYDF